MLSTYREILSRPGALLFSATALVARLPISMVGLGIVLLVSATTGSYGIAGAVSAAYLVANAVFAVIQGRLLDRLVDGGKSVIVIEHHQAVMAHADWIIDLGPGAGHDGGRVVFEGTPAQLVADRSTLTGRHLAAYVGA